MSQHILSHGHFFYWVWCFHSLCCRIDCHILSPLYVLINFISLAYIQDCGVDLWFIGLPWWLFVWVKISEVCNDNWRTWKVHLIEGWDVFLFFFFNIQQVHRNTLDSNNSCVFLLFLRSDVVKVSIENFLCYWWVAKTYSCDVQQKKKSKSNGHFWGKTNSLWRVMTS